MSQAPETMSLFELILVNVHPKIAEAVVKGNEYHYFGESTDNIVDYRYSDLGPAAAKTLFVLVKGGWIYTWSYCLQDGEESTNFEVFNPKEVLKLRSLLNLNDISAMV